MSTIHILLLFVGALGIAAGFVLTLITPVLLGLLIGTHVKSPWLSRIGMLLSLTSISGSVWQISELVYHPNSLNMWPMLPFFVPMYMGLGVFIGRLEASKKERTEISLANWRKQLVADRQTDSRPQRLSHDYLEIACLLNSLGQRQEAIDEYRQGMTIMEISLGSHPAMAKVYKGYLELLKEPVDAEEIARIKAKQDTLPKL